MQALNYIYSHNKNLYAIIAVSKQPMNNSMEENHNIIWLDFRRRFSLSNRNIYGIAG